MRGCRKLNVQEVQRLLSMMESKYHKPVVLRNRALMILMLGTGLRIGEALSLRIGQVWEGERVLGTLYLDRNQSKTKEAGANMELNPIVQDFLREFILWAGLDQQPSNYPLFPAGKGSSSNQPSYWFARPLNDRSFRKVLDRLCKCCFIEGKVSTHSFRKTFAAEMYALLGNDLQATQYAMRHSNITSTIAYLQVHEGKVRQVQRGMLSSFIQGRKLG